MKVCTKCGESTPLSEFYRDASRRCGLSAWCKHCDKVSNAAYNAANKARIAERNAEYHAANREKINAHKAKRRAENPEKLTIDAVKRARIDPETIRIYAHNRRARKREVGGKLSKGIAEHLHKLQRGKCVCCKQPLGTKYHRDHILPLALGGTNTDNNIQLLCPTCNLQKSAKHPVTFMQQQGFLL